MFLAARYMSWYGTGRNLLYPPCVFEQYWYQIMVLLYLERPSVTPAQGIPCMYWYIPSKHLKYVVLVLYYTTYRCGDSGVTVYYVRCKVPTWYL